MRHKEGRGRETAVIFKTGLGWAGIAATEKGITLIVLPRRSKAEVERELSAESGIRSSARTDHVNARLSAKAVNLLLRYFSGESVTFDLPLDIVSYTPFQRAVWRAAAAIPYGETRSYGWIARRIGRPHSSRAVGQALGANPLPIVVPCHRVISASGTLGGFSGGLGTKKKLLELEALKSFTARAPRTRRKA